MGAHWSNCLLTCIFLIWGICIHCHPKNAKAFFESVPPANISAVQQGWANLRTVSTADGLCGYLNGKLHDDAQCDLDFSQVDSSGILSAIEGVNTADHLCGVIEGSYKDTVCTVNLQGAGAGSVLDKKLACDDIEGKWTDDNCVLKTAKK